MPMQPRFMSGPFFTVLNRTSRPLEVMVDGTPFIMQPGANRDVPAAVAQYAEKQHPRRGTWDDKLQDGESLLVIKELCTDPARMSMIPPGKEHLGDEMINRQEFPHAHPVTLEKVSRPGKREDPFDGETTGIDFNHENPPA